MQTEDLVTTREVMLRFHRSERTIRNWVARGHLLPVRIGRSVFFRVDDIDVLIQRNAPPPLKVVELAA